MNPINKNTVLKQVRTQGEWKGYVAPSNVNQYHIKGGWHLGMNITIVSGKEVSGNEKEYYYFSEQNESFQELETWLNSFMYYNCNPELGQRIRFWQE
jgi:hypothetical protein